MQNLTHNSKNTSFDYYFIKLLKAFLITVIPNNFNFIFTCCVQCISPNIPAHITHSLPLWIIAMNIINLTTIYTAVIITCKGTNIANTYWYIVDNVESLSSGRLMNMRNCRPSRGIKMAVARTAFLWIEMKLCAN